MDEKIRPKLEYFTELPLLKISSEEFEFEKNRLKNLIPDQLKKSEEPIVKSTPPKANEFTKVGLLLAWADYFQSDFFTINEYVTQEKSAEKYIEDQLKVSAFKLNEIFLWVRLHFTELQLGHCYRWLAITRSISKLIDDNKWDSISEKSLYYRYMVTTAWGEKEYPNALKGENTTSLEEWSSFWSDPVNKGLKVNPHDVEFKCSEDLFWCVSI